MKVTILGSSHGVPEAGRKCTCILVQTGESAYFVDMGSSGIDPLRKRHIPIEAVKGIFITHMHGDHINGLVEFADLITWYFRDADPVICLPDPEAGKVIRDWLEVTLNGCQRELRYLQTQAGPVYDDGILKVSAIPTRHCKNSFAYLLEAEGKRLLFTGDLRSPGEDFPVSALEQPLDLVVCEAAHFEATDYLPIFTQHAVRQICITHYSHRFLPGVETLCRTLNGRGIPALQAADDLELIL